LLRDINARGNRRRNQERTIKRNRPHSAQVTKRKQTKHKHNTEKEIDEQFKPHHKGGDEYWCSRMVHSSSCFW